MSLANLLTYERGLADTLTDVAHRAELHEAIDALEALLTADPQKAEKVVGAWDRHGEALTFGHTKTFIPRVAGIAHDWGAADRDTYMAAVRATRGLS